MKKELVYKILLFIFFLIVWIFPVYEFIIETETYVFMLAFATSVILLYIVNNRVISGICILIIMVAVSIYNFEYLSFWCPSIFLLGSHKFIVDEVYEKKKNKTKDSLVSIYTTTSMILIFVQFISFFFVYKAEEEHYFKSTFLILRIIVVFVLFFTYLFSQTYDKKEKKRQGIVKSVTDSLRLIYIVSAVGIVISMFNYFFANKISLRSVRTEFLGWYVFIISIINSKDPFLEAGMKKIKKFLSAI